MKTMAIDFTNVLFILIFAFIVLLACCPYFLWLYWGGFYKKSSLSLSVRQMIHNFYVLCTCFTLGVTAATLYFSPKAFYAGTVLFFVLALICAYLFYLQSTDLFKCLVISQQLPVVPLIVTILTTLFGCFFTAFHVYTHMIIIERAFMVAFLSETFQAYIESENQSSPTPLEQDISKQATPNQESPGGERLIPTPLERVDTPKKSSWLKWAIGGQLINRWTHISINPPAHK